LLPLKRHTRPPLFPYTTLFRSIVYQEQVMQIAQKMGGYTLGGADLLRRAMGKKKEEEMAKQKATFVEGAVALGTPDGEAGYVFEDRKSTRLNSSHVKISYAVFC